MIDCNCFFGKRLRGREYLSLKDFDPLLKSGINRIFISTTKLSHYDVVEGNQEILDICTEADFLYPVITFPLDVGNINREEEFLKIDSRVYRLYLDPGFSVCFKDQTLVRFLKGLTEKRGSLIITYEPTTHGLIDEIASHFPKLSIILTGINYPQFRSSLGIFETHSNTYIETSYFSLFNGIEHLIKALDSDRLIFGTNSPLYAHRSNVIKLQKANISEADKKKISQKNILKAIGEIK